MYVCHLIRHAPLQQIRNLIKRVTTQNTVLEGYRMPSTRITLLLACLCSLAAPAAAAAAAVSPGPSVEAVVHVVFANHLDVGFTGWDNETLNAYFHSHIPRAVSKGAVCTFGDCASCHAVAPCLHPSCHTRTVTVLPLTLKTASVPVCFFPFHNRSCGWQSGQPRQTPLRRMCGPHTPGCSHSTWTAPHTSEWPAPAWSSSRRCGQRCAQVCSCDGCGCCCCWWWSKVWISGSSCGIGNGSIL